MAVVLVAAVAVVLVVAVAVAVAVVLVAAVAAVAVLAVVVAAVAVLAVVVVAVVLAAAVPCLCRSRHSLLIRRRTRCRLTSSSHHRAGTRHLWGRAASARQLGLRSLARSTIHRRGDTYEPDDCGVAAAAALAMAETSTVDLPTRKPALPTRKGPALGPCPLFSPSVWGCFFGQTIHNHYQAFVLIPAPAADLGGFQGGIDLLRGSDLGGYDRAGLYGAYGDVHADINGLVTNPAATAYVLNRTGSMNLNSWSAGGYWTHTGPSGWYLDAVLQGTWYYGSASTQFARLNTDGTGFIAFWRAAIPSLGRNLGRGS